MIVSLEEKYLKGFVTEEDINNIKDEFKRVYRSLVEKKGLGNDFLGWLNLPNKITYDELKEIEETAAKIRESSDAVVFIGIGGSYLGTKAVFEAIYGPFYNELKKPKIYFAGHNISSDYISELVSILKDKDISLIVISKSGTTTEPAIAFRILKKIMLEKYGDNAYERIYAITDEKKGSLRSLSNLEGYKSWSIPDDVGGRFSVFTPVGLLPLAVCGVNIREFVNGAKLCFNENDSDSLSLPLNRYSVIRNILYRKGFKIEILANFEPYLHYITEWWKQLYGESEGKKGKGLFPAGADFTTDLHSIGQWIQQAERTIFETFLIIEKSKTDVFMENEENNGDELNYLAGLSLNDINRKAWEGTSLAHFTGGVPNITLTIPDRSEKSLGYLLYFFEKACGISGYILGVNPFDQPGVEEYKKNMFKLLKKPGY